MISSPRVPTSQPKLNSMKFHLCGTTLNYTTSSNKRLKTLVPWKKKIYLCDLIGRASRHHMVTFLLSDQPGKLPHREGHESFACWNVLKANQSWWASLLQLTQQNNDPSEKAFSISKHYLYDYGALTKRLEIEWMPTAFCTYCRDQEITYKGISINQNLVPSKELVLPHERHL